MHFAMYGSEQGKQRWKAKRVRHLLSILKEDWYPTSFSCHVEDASQTLTQWMSVQAKV
jgi:hypothetical protein